MVNAIPRPRCKLPFKFARVGVSIGVHSVAQNHITFEWILEESRVDFWHTPEDEMVGRGHSLQSAEQILAARLLRGLALLLVVIAAAAGAGITSDERELREAHQGIVYTIGLENEAWQKRNRNLNESLIDPNLDDDWVVAWRDHWRAAEDAEPSYKAELLYVRKADGIIQATVLTQQPAFEWWQINPYREERFYRLVDQRWLRTVPSPAFWGEARQFKTDHLHFYYYERDQAAVEAAAAKLETAYVAIYETLGVGAPPPQRQQIAIVPSPTGRWSSVDRLHVTSPLLAQIPNEQSDAEYVAYEVMGWFTYRAIRDATPNTAGRYLYRWPILVLGLRSWLRHDLLDQPSPWHMHARDVLREASPEYLPLRLDQITNIATDRRPTRDEVVLRYLTAESFIQFVVERYGREHLPDFLTALVRYGTWQEIIPPLFGDSVEKFVQEWNAHLLEEYGLEDLAME